MDRDRIVAVALLTQRDLEIWGAALRNVYPVTEDKDFDTLLREIDANCGPNQTRPDTRSRY